LLSESRIVGVSHLPSDECLIPLPEGCLTGLAADHGLDVQTPGCGPRGSWGRSETVLVLVDRGSLLAEGFPR
ncbi:MAG: hypothetical protein WBP81_26660, partial [Solirubrobacteraceae bacterium]